VLESSEKMHKKCAYSSDFHAKKPRHITIATNAFTRKPTLRRVYLAVGAIQNFFWLFMSIYWPILHTGSIKFHRWLPLKCCCCYLFYCFSVLTLCMEILTMIQFKQLLGASLLLFALASTAQAALPAADSQNQPLPTLAPLIKKSTPAVVNIAVSATQQMQNPLLNDPYFRRFFNIPGQAQQRKVQSAGSGVIIDAAKGIIVTNNHVVERADEIKVSLHNGLSYTAKLLGTDPQVDIAVLQIEAKNLSSLNLANSDKTEVGDFVVAIGNPFGLNQTVTSGIVSAIGRSGLNMENYENFIQTDASINPGNSGGALINLRGELVGINTAIIAPSGGNVGIGFAIPVNMAMNSVNQILQHGKVTRGQLGIVIQDITDDLAQAFNLPNDNGVLVAQVEKGSAAEKAGLKSGDVILNVNTAAVNSPAELRNKVGMHRIGDKMALSVFRGGKTLNLTAIIGAVNALGGDGGSLEFSTAIAKRLEGAHFSDADGNGVRVTSINPNSAAMMTGLEVGDVIVSANQRSVKSLKELREAINLDKNRLLLQIMRNDMALYLVIR
jgi:Do/DeqQ family serine protease